MVVAQVRDLVDEVGQADGLSCRGVAHDQGKASSHDRGVKMRLATLERGLEALGPQPRDDLVELRRGDPGCKEVPAARRHRVTDGAAPVGLEYLHAAVAQPVHGAARSQHVDPILSVGPGVEERLPLPVHLFAVGHGEEHAVDGGQHGEDGPTRAGEPSIGAHVMMT